MFPTFTYPSSPSKAENLLGSILWLREAKDIPTHGRYNLRKAECNHPCVVVQDCRNQQHRHLKICILTAFSGMSSFQTLSAVDKSLLVPISPNQENPTSNPRILNLRPRQRQQLNLRKDSWINTKHIFEVPVELLTPYEHGQSWCRYRLTDTSTQALVTGLHLAPTTKMLPSVSSRPTAELSPSTTRAIEARSIDPETERHISTAHLEYQHPASGTLSPLNARDTLLRAFIPPSARRYERCPQDDDPSPFRRHSPATWPLISCTKSIAILPTLPALPTRHDLSAYPSIQNPDDPSEIPGQPTNLHPLLTIAGALTMLAFAILS